MGVSNLGDLVATAQLDISPFLNNTRQLQTYLRGLDNSLKTMETNFKGQKDKLSGLQTTYTQTGHSLKGYQELLRKQSNHYLELKNKIGDVNNATSEQKNYLTGAQSAMMATAAKVAELQNKYNALAREIATQSSLWTKFGTNLTQSGKELKAFGEATEGVGKALTAGLTVPIMAGAGYAVKAAIQYESAFAGVRKTVDETATTSYEKLSKSIRQLSKELPASASQIARVAEVSGQLGISADNIMDFTKVMIDMGESTNLSAEDAATAIAKIANITGMTTDEYQKFGSSVVALGNNFATTEADILQMANRMAASGTIAGLTNQEILGLATAMSSVGIEAEAGGTAMSQTLTAIEKAVATGSDKLQGFADIAGMTADQFTQKWKTSPAEALQAFITGLGKLDEKGESATLTLDDLGLSGIRQSNMLKSLGKASETMTSAIDMSNKAWDENKALTDEAGKRYETTESKLKMLRNEVTDIAIEFGGPLVDALRDGLEVAKPWIQTASDMAKAFSALDKEQQQQIIKWGLIAVAAGPTLTTFGKGVGVLGSVFEGLGKVSTVLGKVSGALQTGTPLLSTFTRSAGTAATASGGLASAVGLLGNPITWGVLLGGAALVAVSYLAQEATNARQRTEEWGTEVDRVQAGELTKFKDKVDETNQAMTTFSENGVQDVEAVKVAFQGLVDEITKLTDKELVKDLKIAEQMGMSPEVIAQIKKSHEQMKSNVQQMSDEVIAIYQRASEQRRQLTEEEKSIVLANQNELIDAQLSLLDYSEKEKLAITKAMNGQFDELNLTQLAKYKDVAKKWIEEERKSYDERKNNLNELYDSIKGSDEAAVRARSEIQADLSQLEADHLAKMDAYGQRYAEIRKKMAEQVTFTNEYEEQSYWNVIKKEMEELGLSYEELMVKSTQASSKIQEGHSMWAQTVADASEETKTANSQWNAMTWDLKEGKLKTNTQEEIQKALQAEGGWENLKFVAKHANLDTNAKIAIGEALEATGQWDSLSPQDKALVVDGQPAIKAIVESKENLAIWNSMPEGVKKLLGENQQFMSSAETAKTTLNNWNLLQPTQKDLIANDLASGNAASA
ncbi:TPA: phage tail tape measure protein, partial [Streptococcus suis]